MNVANDYTCIINIRVTSRISMNVVPRSTMNTNGETEN